MNPVGEQGDEEAALLVDTLQKGPTQAPALWLVTAVNTAGLKDTVQGWCSPSSPPLSALILICVRLRLIKDLGKE